MSRELPGSCGVIPPPSSSVALRARHTGHWWPGFVDKCRCLARDASALVDKCRVCQRGGQRERHRLVVALCRDVAVSI